MSEMMLAHTGDGSNQTPISQAILNGYAKDSPNAEGELYTLREYPELTVEELTALQGAPYSEVFHLVTRKFLADCIDEATLRHIATSTYVPDLFDFDNGRLQLQTTPSGVYVVGLSDGPTGAFKDMAMQPFARWVEAIRTRKGLTNQLSILLSTSGDTGPAALSAFGGRKNIQMIAMFPDHGVSEFQRAQMVGAHNGSDVHALEVESDFSGINDIHMAANIVYDLGAVNSVNIARLLAQVPYHVASYLQVIEAEGKAIGDPVDVAIPSGNFGNGLAAIIARKMGLPIRNIIIATNENDTLERFFNHQEFSPNSTTVPTDSSAQDITMPSNIWRYLAMVFDNDTDKVAAVYQQLRATGSVDMHQFGVMRPELVAGITAVRVDSLGRKATMQVVFSDSGKTMMIDPHTANAVRAAEASRHDGVPIVAYETAKPFKFPDSIQAATGELPTVPSRFQNVVADAAGKQVPHIQSEADVLDYLGRIGVAHK